MGGVFRMYSDNYVMLHIPQIKKYKTIAPTIAEIAQGYRILWNIKKKIEKLFETSFTSQVKWMSHEWFPKWYKNFTTKLPISWNWQL